MPIRLHDLPRLGRDKLLSRISALELNPMPWLGSKDGRLKQPPNTFHGEGIGWCKGVLLLRFDCEVHGLCHEVGHLAQLKPEEWTALDNAHVATSENVSLLIQVELARDVDGLRVGGMLTEMEDLDYVLYGKRDTAVTAAHWWSINRDTMWDSWLEADRITERWQAT